MKIRHPWMLWFVAWLGTGAARLLFWTVRVKTVLAAPGTDPYENTSSNRYLYCVWHDSVLALIFSRRSQAMAGLVSKHADGSLLTTAMEIVGILPVRGSSQHGGAAAVCSIMDVSQTHDVSIAVDGPRGPRRRIKEGIVFIASQTGRPIIPVIVVAERAWRPFGKWTDMVVPVPFSRAVLIAAQPFVVAPDLSREAIAQVRNELQTQMDELHAILEHQPADAALLAEQLKAYYSRPTTVERQAA